jgi:hypothetical protein
MVEKESDLKSTVKNLESKIGILEEEIRTMQKNEEIVGRTLITLNQKVKKLEEKPTSVQTQTTQETGDFATKEEFKELKYTIDMINPLQYATIDQVKEVVEDIIEKKLKKT